jgi:predicted transcriptional regulator
MENKEYRGSIDIIADILRICKKGSRKTRTMYLANLSWTQLEKYLKLLINKKLLEYDSIEKKYRTTNKGLEFLRAYFDAKEEEKVYLKRMNTLKKFI